MNAVSYSTRPPANHAANAPANGLAPTANSIPATTARPPNRNASAIVKSPRGTGRSGCAVASIGASIASLSALPPAIPTAAPSAAKANAPNEAVVP